MATPAGRTGRLAGDPEAELAFWTRVFDPATGQLRLQREGGFWDAVATARRTGASGDGRCIAIIDGGFDMTVAQLQHRVHPASRVRSDTVAATDRHGTRVALLARAVAPEAELLLLDVRDVTDEDVAQAIGLARSLNADIINLSLEFSSNCEPMGSDWVDASLLAMIAPPVEAFVAQVDAWIAHSEPYQEARCRGRCAICTALADVPPETLVVAASGNSFDATCPACVGRVVGAGFHETRVVERDGVVFTTRGLPQTKSQQIRSELTVEEPPGFLGTSFAAPLLSGFAALLPAPRDIASMAWLAKAMTPVLVLANAHASTPPSEIPEGAPQTVHHGLLRIAAAVPAHHQHWSQALVTEPCAACALLMVDWYDVFTSILIATGVPESAAEIARIAAVLAPDVASVNANWGLACRRLAEKTADNSQRRKLLTEAEVAYRRAVGRAADVARYARDLADVTAALNAN